MSDFFDTTPPPPHLDLVADNVQRFLDLHSSIKIVLVTSGGTTVPLEENTVRFLDNFSAGTRGSASAEYFLESGYAVIFLHRTFSLEPWTRHFLHSNFLDHFKLNLNKDGLEVVSNALLLKMFNSYQETRARLLKIDFTTVRDYLFLLRRITQLMSKCGANGMYYLAAAVSDFFIPFDKMTTHKIQSTGSGGLCLTFENVPKMIQPLVSNWAKGGFIVSFKLETDPNLLKSKSISSLVKYGHQLVIGNILNTRKVLVELITESSSLEIRLTNEQVASGVEIESKLVEKLITLHDQWISTSCISL